MQNQFEMDPEAQTFVQLGGPYPTGLDPMLNWRLCYKQIVPMDLAFRNPSFNVCVSRMDPVQATVDSTKIAHIHPVSNPNHSNPRHHLLSHTAIKDDPNTWIKNTVSYQKSKLDKLLVCLRDTRLSASPNLFVHDGAIGSIRKEEVRLTVISDNAIHALFLKHLLEPAPLGRTPGHTYAWQTTLTVYCSTSFVPTQAEAEKMVLGSHPVTAFDPEKGILVVGGTHSPAVLRDLLVQGVGMQFFKRGIIPLSCEVATTANSAPSLVFGHGDAVVKALGKAQLYGNRHHLWGEFGVHRMWKGHTDPLVDQTLKKGDVVEYVGTDPSLVTTTPAAREAACLEHPGAAIFVVSDPSNVFPAVAQVSEQALRDVFLAGFLSKETAATCYSNTNLGVPPTLLADSFAAKAKAAGMAAYIVNITGLAPPQVAAVVAALTATRPKGTSALGNTGLSSFDSFENLDAALLRSSDSSQLASLFSSSKDKWAAVQTPADFVTAYKAPALLPPHSADQEADRPDSRWTFFRNKRLVDNWRHSLKNGPTCV